MNPIQRCLKIAEQGTCTRLKVGCMIVQGKYILAEAFNTSLPGEPLCTDVGCLTPHGHCIRTIHAERSALAHCAKHGIATQGASIMITHFPCLDCVKQIIASGIMMVYYINDYKSDDYVLELFRNASVVVVKLQ